MNLTTLKIKWLFKEKFYKLSTQTILRLKPNNSVRGDALWTHPGGVTVQKARLGQA